MATKGFNIYVGTSDKYLWITNTCHSNFVSFLENDGSASYELSYKDWHEFKKQMDLADEIIKQLESEKQESTKVFTELPKKKETKSKKEEK